MTIDHSRMHSYKLCVCLCMCVYRTRVGIRIDCDQLSMYLLDGKHPREFGPLFDIIQIMNDDALCDRS